MEIKVGTDIIEVERIKESIERLGEKFLNRVYTKNEIEYCEKTNSMKFQHYAARFAAKEAVFKAISKLLNNKFDISWKDIEIKNDENGRPYVELYCIEKQKIADIDISLSHIKDYAIAMVAVTIR